MVSKTIYDFRSTKMKSTQGMQLVFVLCVTICRVASQTRAVHEVCGATSECPAHSTCRPTSCDGYTCLCDAGWVSSESRSMCLRASRIGETCEPDVTRCISEYARCEAGVCTCLNGFKATKDGRCKLPVSNFVGEPCGGQCEFPARCEAGMCQCLGDFRSLTTDEFWVDPISVLQCRPRMYSLDKCNGTSILREPEVSIHTTREMNPESSVTGNEWSLILPDKSVYEACSAHAQCPSNSRCRPNSCDGFVCLCDVGFIASEDRLQCLPAIKIGSSCDKRIETCLSPSFAKCEMGICSCDPYTTPTIDGRCRITNTRYIGESCRGNEECEYPGTCQSGQCACANEYREITEEEFWIDPTLTIQCRPRQAVKRDISLTRTNILANKSLSAAEEEALSQKHLALEQPMNAGLTMEQPMTHGLENGTMRAQMSPVNNIAHIAIPSNNLSAHSNAMAVHNNILTSNSIPMLGNIAIYNKHGWHEGFADRSFYDNTTDMYPESITTTRSTGPFIVDSPKSSPTGVVSPFAINRNGPYIVDGRGQDTINAHGPYIVDGRSQDTINAHGPYIVDGRVGTNDSQGNVHYANDPAEWRTECTSDQEPDLVLF
ncbi:hypothetical protein MAR_002980 [Mya arenaria]|uniref:EGF-like domain-containing protein n=1 Tax=Mya arenaria TaxID=6604 RepID=A0ABY7G7V4_MYAAR|nr:hypothetical protein MAR_002980 [Mya arenaria]